MRSDSFHRSGGNYFSVLTDVEVIACSVESPPPVAFFQVVLREAAVFSRGGAVNHDQIDFSHSSGSIFRCSPRGETSGTPGCIPVFSVISSSFFAVLSFVVSRFCHRGHRVTRSFVEKVYPIKYIFSVRLCATLWCGFMPSGHPQYLRLRCLLLPGRLPIPTRSLRCSGSGSCSGWRSPVSWPCRG